MAWVASLGWLLARDLTTRGSREAALRAFRIGPATAAYVVELDGVQVGYATHVIDTVPGALRVEELWDLDVPDYGRSGRLLLSSSASLSRRVELREAQVGLPRGRLSVDVGADSSVRGIRPAAGDRADTVVTPAGAEPVLPSTLPVALVAGGAMRVGRTAELAVIDPATLVPRRVRLRLVAESTFTIADSVVYDTAAGRWAVARTERLPGWRAEVEGVPATWLWVDGQGQVIDAALPNGLRLRRTLYELAKDDYRAAPPPPPPPAAWAAPALARFLEAIGAERRGMATR